VLIDSICRYTFRTGRRHPVSRFQGRTVFKGHGHSARSIDPVPFTFLSAQQRSIPHRDRPGLGSTIAEFFTNAPTLKGSSDDLTRKLLCFLVRPSFFLSFWGACLVPHDLGIFPMRCRSFTQDMHNHYPYPAHVRVRCTNSIKHFDSQVSQAMYRMLDLYSAFART
jgi:hypothetical protein